MRGCGQYYFNTPYLYFFIIKLYKRMTENHAFSSLVYATYFSLEKRKTRVDEFQ